jgi:hypothetical protein
MKHFHPQFAPMSKAYESLKHTISVFKDEKKDIDMLKIKFETKERADEICKLLLGD